MTGKGRGGGSETFGIKGRRGPHGRMENCGGLKSIRDRKWEAPKLMVGRRAGEAVMDFLRTGRTGTILFPLPDAMASHLMEALDHTDTLPILIPAIYLCRVDGRLGRCHGLRCGLRRGRWRRSGGLRNGRST